MHLHIQSTCDVSVSSCSIRSLCWLPQSNTNEKVGWLVVNNVMGTAGITRTSLNDNISKSFNLYTEHHKAHIAHIKWNDVTQKFVTCDELGNICQWIPGKNNWIVGSSYQINYSLTSNSAPQTVVDMAWSHSGRILVVCFSDGFLSILEEHEYERRSYTLVNPIFKRVFSCLTFDPDDKYILLGTLDGYFIAVDILNDNAVLHEIETFNGDSPVQCIVWNCPSFYTQETNHLWQNRDFTLGICLKNGILILQTSYDDDFPVIVHTGLYNIIIQWNRSGELVAVAGQKKLHKPCKCDNDCSFTNYFDPYTYFNAVRIFNKEGCKLVYTDITEGSSLLECAYVTGIHWAHRDTCLFVASGQLIHTVRIVQELITNDIPTLQQICCNKVCELLEKNKQIQTLILPPAVQAQLNFMLQSVLNHPLSLYENKNLLYCPSEEYFYCTLKKRSEEIYMLYVEFLGSLIPFLGAIKSLKRCSEFIIFDSRKSDVIADVSTVIKKHYCTEQRISKPRQLLRVYKRNTKIQDLLENNSNVADMQEIHPTNILAVVTSNIWKTKFKIQKSSQKKEFELMGKINYSTSVLHMVPRIIYVELVNAETQKCDKHRENNLVFDNVLPKTSMQVLTIDMSRDPIRVKYLAMLLPWTFCFDCKSLAISMDDMICSEFCYNSCCKDSLNYMYNWPSIFFSNITKQRKLCLISKEVQHLNYMEESNICLLQCIQVILINISNSSNHYTYTVFESSFNEWEFYDKLTRKNQTDVLKNCKKIWENSTCRRFGCKYNDNGHSPYTNECTFQNMWDELTPTMMTATHRLRDCNANRLKDNRETLQSCITLQNKTPTWNKEQCIHQLECGGRVTVESEKNCQFEYNGKQTLQFGRIGTSEFTLDFCYPFSPIQAFAVALSSLTRGMK